MPDPQLILNKKLLANTDILNLIIILVYIKLNENKLLEIPF